MLSAGERDVDDRDVDDETLRRSSSLYESSFI